MSNPGSTLRQLIEEHCRRTGERVVGFVVGYPGDLTRSSRDSGLAVDDLERHSRWGESSLEETLSEMEEDGRVAVPRQEYGVLHGPERLSLLEFDAIRHPAHKYRNGVCVWTDESILFLDQYDGAHRLCSLPRNPKPHMPIMPGG